MCKKYFKRFLKDENGSEMIQFAIIIAIVAGLAVLIFNLASSSGNKIQEAQSLIDGIDISGGGF